MKKRLYIISPFRLAEYPWNWKVYYCVELFSALFRRGYIVNWLQPGKNLYNFNLFPSLSHWRNFFVINIGNSLTYRWLMPFFLSRLKRVSKDIKPFPLIEIIDGNPFELDIDEAFVNIPIIFSLRNQWVASNDFPGPVIIPLKEILKDLIYKGVPEKYLNYIPMGVCSNVNEITNTEKQIQKRILILDKDRQRHLKSLAEQIEKEKPHYDILYIGNKDLNTIPAEEFHDWIQKIIDGREIIAVLSKNLYHIGMEFISKGAKVFVPALDLPFEGDNENLFFYDTPMDIPNRIYTLLEQKPTFSHNNKILFSTWEEGSIQLEKLLTELINE